MIDHVRSPQSCYDTRQRAGRGLEQQEIAAHTDLNFWGVCGGDRERKGPPVPNDHQGIRRALDLLRAPMVVPVLLTVAEGRDPHLKDHTDQVVIDAALATLREFDLVTEVGTPAATTQWTATIRGHQLAEGIKVLLSDESLDDDSPA